MDMQEEAKEPSTASATKISLSLSKSKRFIFMVAIPLIICLALIILYALGGRYVETENAYIKADKVPISAQVSGVIKDILVQENQNVSKDQLLFRLDPKPFQVALARAESKLAQERIDLLALKASFLEKRADIALARTKHNFALRNEKRLTDLAQKHFTSLSSLDDARENSKIAAQQILSIEQDLNRLAESLGGSIDTPVEQHPSYLMAKAELEQAKLDLAHTEVRAPVSGTINSPPKQAQYIQAGSIAMTLVTNDHPWVEANFPEKELTYVRPGESVVITIDLYPGKKFSGVVESLSPATGSEFSIIPAQNATGNWVKVAQRVAVRIKLSPEANDPKLRSGLSSWVKIDTGHSRYAPHKTA